VTDPGDVHVKLVAEELGAEKEPLGADHAYARLPGSTPVAVAVTATEFPTVVSDGLSATDPTAPQLYVWPDTAADPDSDRPALHCMRADTFVVVRATMENCADPAQVTEPSIEVPVSAMT
jgi:hypothetical protein